jgi:predicted nucleotidyltransferase
VGGGQADAGEARSRRPGSVGEVADAAAFDALVAAAAEDDNVLGVVLGGSRGKGVHVTEASDWDVYVVVRDRPAGWRRERGGALDAVLLTLDELRGMPDWNRYALAHVEPVVDKTGGELAAAVAALGRRDPATAGEPLDAYVNFYYRSLKNDERGLDVESRLDAAESVPWWLEFLFTAHGRVRPYNKWLRWELSTHRLGDPWSEERVTARLMQIVATGDIEDQRSLFRETEAFARARGLGSVIDAWQPDVPFLRGGAAR